MIEKNAMSRRIGGGCSRQDMPKIVGIGVLTDTDSTHTQITAGYADIELDSDD